MDEKENSGKGSNLKSLSCKGDFNHYISFFPFKIMLRVFFKALIIVLILKKSDFFLLLGIVLYCMIIVLCPMPYLICCYYLVFVKLRGVCKHIIP